MLVNVANVVHVEPSIVVSTSSCTPLPLVPEAKPIQKANRSPFENAGEVSVPTPVKNNAFVLLFATVALEPVNNPADAVKGPVVVEARLAIVVVPSKPSSINHTEPVVTVNVAAFDVTEPLQALVITQRYLFPVIVISAPIIDIVEVVTLE